VLDRIAPTAAPRSSIIVSDEPLSSETNYRTEFVAVLNNQPQGGFVTRRPTADVIANGESSDDDGGFGSFFQPDRHPQPGNMRPRGGQLFFPMQQRGLWYDADGRGWAESLVNLDPIRPYAAAIHNGGSRSAYAPS
jgi:hypothetical protein